MKLSTSFLFVVSVFTYVTSWGQENGKPTKVGCAWGNCQNGYGKWSYEDGDYYIGFFQNSQMQGPGAYTWTNIGTYIGAWNHGAMEGFGVFRSHDGASSVGQYKNSRLNGKAMSLKANKTGEYGIYTDGKLTEPYTYNSNNLSTGCLAGDCKNKFGQFKWSNGDVFTGFFENGKLKQGTYIFASGGEYHGMFNQDNQFEGMGRYLFKDGAVYLGNWLNGKYHGKGIYYGLSKEEDKIGEWSNGTFVKSS